MLGSILKTVKGYLYGHENYKISHKSDCSQNNFFTEKTCPGTRKWGLYWPPPVAKYTHERLDSETFKIYCAFDAHIGDVCAPESRPCDKCNS